MREEDAPRSCLRLLVRLHLTSHYKPTSHENIRCRSIAPPSALLAEQAMPQGGTAVLRGRESREPLGRPGRLRRSASALRLSAAAEGDVAMDGRRGIVAAGGGGCASGRYEEGNLRPRLSSATGMRCNLRACQRAPGSWRELAKAAASAAANLQCILWRAGTWSVQSGSVAAVHRLGADAVLRPTALDRALSESPAGTWGESAEGRTE
jgi:hypothetical protein